MSTVWGTDVAPPAPTGLRAVRVLLLATLVLVPRMGPGRRWVFRGVVALSVLLVLMALARRGVGELQGLTNLLLPVTLLALVSRREVREYLHGTSLST